LMVFPIPRLSFGFAQLIGIMNQFKGAVLNPYTSPSFLFSSAESDKRAVKLPEAKRGFVLLPRRWVGERSFAWSARFRRLAKDYERLPQTLAGFHLLAFAILMLRQFVNITFQSA